MRDGAKPVPFVDLNAQYQTIKPEIDAAIQGVIDRSAFVGGDAVGTFEAELAAYCAAGGDAAPSSNGRPAGPAGGPLHCVGCANGTDAIYLALRALEIGPGDEVITVAHTFTATAEAIVLAGARPVFVDIRPDTMLIDPDAIEPAITPATKAIIPVHLYGQPCEMDRIMSIASRHGLKVVEDSAQAHGARWRGRRPGALGDVATFSFYPGKNLGAYGDAGAVVSSNEALIERIRMLADHGRMDKYHHLVAGTNSRLDGLQAAVLSVKLRHLDEWNDARRRHAARYLEALQDSGVGLPAVHPDAEPVWHLFVVRTPEREDLQARLSGQGIASGIHYPVPLHRQPAYAYLGVPAGSLPVSERVAAEVVSLPIYAELPGEAQARVIEIAGSFAGAGTR
jgi:dTDP-4-amino-4,6-dideoxygalactose transaminase